MPATPIKCAGAPQKIMYLAEDHFRRMGVRDAIRVVYASATPMIFGVAKYRRALEKVVSDRGMQTCFRHSLIEVCGDTQALGSAPPVLERHAKRALSQLSRQQFFFESLEVMRHPSIE